MARQFKLTVKGQVTIPKDVRDVLGLKPGDRVAFDREGDGIVVRRVDHETGAEKTFDQRLARALELSRPLPMDMSTDDYMSMIREPVPIPVG